MEAFPTIPSHHYQQLRHEIRSGDILLCSGHSVFSTLIQKATNSIWSHVAFILRIDAIDRIMVLESVESIGVRTVSLSSYINDYNASGRGYPGRLMLARHRDVKADNIPKLSRAAVDLLGYPYGTQEVLHIAARLSLHNVGIPDSPPDKLSKHQFICSEYAALCFQSIGAHVDFNPMGFISPDDFARSEKVTPISFIYTNNETMIESRAMVS